MLSKNHHRTNNTRNRVSVSTRIHNHHTPLWYNLKNRAGRAHTGRITTHHRQGCATSRRLRITPLPHLLLPGTVQSFLWTPTTGTAKAYVKTNTGRHIIIPAVRNLATGNPVNRTPTNGSFITPQRLPQQQTCCNILIQGNTRPQYLRAPGTYAKTATTTTIYLPRHRQITRHRVQYVQMGINAISDWRHTCRGTAGRARTAGRRPIVRNKAKNAGCRTAAQLKFKKTAQLLPWR